MTESPTTSNDEDVLGDTDVTEAIVMAKRHWSYWPRYIGYRLFRLSGELVAIVLGLAIFWFCALNVLLIQQSVDISRFEPNAQMWFSEAFNGSDAQIGDMRLTWLPSSNHIVFNATDVVITDKDGAEIETIPRLQTEIPLSSAVKGALTPDRLIIDGGSVTWMRTNDGNVIAGLGTPDTVGRLGPVWRGNQATGETTRPDISGVKLITVTNATAHIIDDSDGLDLSFRQTDIDFTSDAQEITVAMKSSLQKGSVKAPIEFNMEATPNVKSYKITLTATGLNPSIISPKRGRYSILNTLNTPIDLKASVKVDETNGLETADIDLVAGKGRMKLREKLTEFDDGFFKATLTPDSQIMNIEAIGLITPKFRFAGQGTLSELGKMTDGNVNSSPLFNLVFKDIKLDQTPNFSAPFNIDTLKSSGRLDMDSRRLDLENLWVDFGPYQYSMQGFAQQTPEGQWDHIKFKGKADGVLHPKDILAIWPVNFTGGARRWFEGAVLEASMRNLKFDVDFPRGVLTREQLPNEDNLNVDFDLMDGRVRYFADMTHFTGVTGRGTVHGNRGKFEATGGQVGNVSITSAIADIPRLVPKGGDLIVKAYGEGATSDLIGLIDEKPFEYASKYSVNPQDFGGRGEIELNITRPLLEFVKAEQIQYSANGRFKNASAPFSIGSHKLKNSNVTMTVDREKMVIKGPVSLGAWNVDLNWQETFDYGATPTRYYVEGVMDRDTLDGLGIGFREYFDGKIKLKIDAFGTGLNLSSAKVNADLTESSMQFLDYWRKDIGSAGEFTGELKRRPNGAILFEDMVIAAPGFDVQGRIELANNFRLLDMDLKRANIAGFIDASVQAKPDELNEKLSVFVTGRYLDVSPFVLNAMGNTGGAGLDVPMLLTAGLDKLALDEAYILEDANMLFSHNGTGISNARLGGRTADGGLKLEMLTNEDNRVRNVTVDIPDASEAAFAFLDLDNIEGGRMQINAQLPPIGVKGALNGVAEVEDFQLVQAPILAQMLSIASLQGLFDTLGGSGLKFNEFIVPFSLEEGTLNIRNARVSGPALGMTGHGEIRFQDRELDFDGALVPAYTANSLLGDIPVIGDIFVGKKGEGIFALNYTVKGPFDKTQIAVNPLSALTPGFLRGVFRTKRDKLPDDVISEIESVRPKE